MHPVHRLLGTGLLLLSTLWAAPVATEAAQAAQEDGAATLTVQGQARHYLLRLPPQAEQAARATQEGARLPLVLVLHGGGGHAENAEAMTGFTPLARREGFIVAYPEGSGRLPHRLLTWNAGHCCGRAMTQRANDVGFLRALIDHLVATQPVDPRRVYVTGLSNGGMMSHRVAIELSDRVAAAAPVIASLFGDERSPSRPVPMLMINGALDTSVPVAGGATGNRFADAWDGTPLQPITAQGRFWARANGCAPQPQTVTTGALQRTRYDCPAGREVELLLVADNGHAWPGGQPGTRRADPPSGALNASEAIWAFFATHVKR